MTKAAEAVALVKDFLAELSDLLLWCQGDFPACMSEAQGCLL